MPDHMMLLACNGIWKVPLYRDCIWMYMFCTKYLLERAFLFKAF